MTQSKKRVVKKLGRPKVLEHGAERVTFILYPRHTEALREWAYREKKRDRTEALRDILDQLARDLKHHG